MTAIVDLAARMAVKPESRRLLAMLKAAPRMAEHLEEAFPTLSPLEQKAMICATAFRFMGVMLPAELTLLSHLPPFRGVSEEEIMATFQMLVDRGLLVVADLALDEGGAVTAMRFYSPPLEAVVQEALRGLEASALVGVDGRPLR